jgi:hypothetical protein
MRQGPGSERKPANVLMEQRTISPRPMQMEKVGYTDDSESRIISHEVHQKLAFNRQNKENY